MTSLLSAISNHFKPHRTEAIQRLRINAFSLLATLVLSYLLPVPNLIHAVRVAMNESSAHSEKWTGEWVRLWICRVELAIATIFAFNVIQSLYAIQYPRAPFAPIQSPAAKKRGVPTSAPATPNRFKIPVSPSNTPLPQKPFTYSPSTSTMSMSLSMSKSTYPSSPVSTPSRVLQYSVLSPSPNTSTSTAGIMATPSPIISAYKGKHSGSIGRGLDASYLNKLRVDREDESEEEQ